MRKTVRNQRFDEERALYNLSGADVTDCVFAGPADGESVLKETRDITVNNCSFSLRYPLWHVKGFRLWDSTMDEKTRAALWYDEGGEICGCTLGGIKALRECSDIMLDGCKIISPEFGWKCSNITIKNSSVEAEYAFLDSSRLSLENVTLRGKYSFQYVRGLEISGSILDTKDAFWHSTDVTVRDSVVKGEYLGWFSDGLTLINCKISGTQPLCYCKNLKLINCTMEDTDLSFEYSDVDAEVYGNIVSVKNPRSGVIVADSVGEIITEDPVMECSGKVVLR